LVVVNRDMCWCTVDLESAEELYQKRVTRILTTDFPHYFAIVTRVRQESNTVGPDGGMIASTVIPQVQAVFPAGALTKHIKVGLQVTCSSLFSRFCEVLNLHTSCQVGCSFGAFLLTRSTVVVGLEIWRC